MSRSAAAIPIAAILLELAFAASGAQAASFEDLGGFFGGGTIRFEGLSGDGGTLVGRTTGGAQLGVRWRAGTGWEDLGTPTGNTRIDARAASFDGSRIAGNGDATGGMRWVEGSGWQALNLPNDAVTAAISADGSRVGGWFFFGNEIVQHTGLVLWESGAGTDTYEETFAGSAIQLTDLSADGGIMLATRSFTFGSRVVRVTQEGVSTFPPSEPQNASCIDLCGAVGRAISADGTTIVGGVSLDVFTFAPPQAARWSGTEAPLVLGFLDPPAAEPMSLAYDVSGDGSIVVGESDGRAFIWTEALGMADLGQALAATGLDLSGWTLASARAISSDGTVLAGTGTNPSGAYAIWRAVAPELAAAPSPVPALAGPFRVAAGLTLLALGMRAAKRGRRG
ncbi:MAG: hypothetical protein ACR2P8_00490 [Myxococcota bacterium]